MISELKEIQQDFDFADKNESFTLMKKVAKKLMEISCLESSSKKFIRYIKYIKYRKNEYEVVVEQEGSKKYHFRILDVSNNLVDFGTMSGENEDEIFEKIISNFSFHILKE